MQLGQEVVWLVPHAPRVQSTIDMLELMVVRLVWHALPEYNEQPHEDQLVLITRSETLVGPFYTCALVRMLFKSTIG